MDYKKAYILLFRAITQAIYQLECAPEDGLDDCVKLLKDAQRTTEDIFIHNESAAQPAQMQFKS